TASIDWGDNTQPSIVAVNKVAAKTYAVVGTHTYEEEGNYGIKVTITESDTFDDSTPIVVHDTAVVADTPLIAYPVLGLTTQEGDWISGTVATFIDPALNGPEPATEYTAWVDWGDQSWSTATVVNINETTFAVVGSHHYVEEG